MGRGQWESTTKLLNVTKRRGQWESTTKLLNVTKRRGQWESTTKLLNVTKRRGQWKEETPFGSQNIKWFLLRVEFLFEWKYWNL